LVFLKNGHKFLCLGDSPPTFFMRSTNSLDKFLTSLTMLSKSLGSFSGGLVRSRIFFPTELVSLDVGWFSKEINSFLLIVWLSFMSTLAEAQTMWFWYLKLIKEHGQEGQCNCREDYHRWIGPDNVVLVPEFD
jgi:hypothetical protein